MKTHSIILVLTVGLLLTSGCGSKEKEIEAAKAQLELAKQKEFEATKAQLEIAKEQEVQAIKAQLEAAKQKELEAVKAQLELARAKSSLDEMFLALKALQALGDKSETTASEVDNARRGVELLQKTRIAKGEHRHEDVVQHAAEVLEQFPTHPEARKEMKESGLIFRYLQLALDHENACFVADQTGGVQLVKLTKEKSEKEGADFTTIAFNLKKANEFVDEAIKLDAQYDAALGLKKSVRQMQNTMGYLITQSIFKTSNTVRPLLDKTFSFLHSGIQDDALNDRLGSPQGYWRRTRDLRDEAEEMFKSLMASMQEQASFLNQLETPDIQSAAKMAKECTVLTTSLKSAVFSPRGSLNDYKADYLKVDEDFSKLILNWNASTPNSEAIVSDLQGYAKTLVSFKLFKRPDETKQILQKHERLITSA